jgi:cytochrome c553
MSRWLRRLAYVLGTLVLLIAVLAGFAYMKSSQMLTKKYDIPSEPITVVSDSATLARGEHLVKAITKCDDCHSSDFGGKLFLDQMPFARLYSPNITRGEGGVGGTYTDAQFAAVIRHGVKADSTTAIIMPSDAYQELSDEDLGAIIAYIRAQPPVNRSHPKPQLGPIARGLAAAGKLTFFMADAVEPNRTHVASVPPGQYGRIRQVSLGDRRMHQLPRPRTRRRQQA